MVRPWVTCHLVKEANFRCLNQNLQDSPDTSLPDNSPRCTSMPWCWRALQSWQCWWQDTLPTILGISVLCDKLPTLKSLGDWMA